MPTEPGTLTNKLTPADECQKCHAFVNNEAHAGAQSVAPSAWRGSMMGLAARDPVYWAGVAIAHQDAPEETTDCIRCHAPRAFIAGRQDAIAMEDLEPSDLEGVDCELCHRMIDDGVTPPGNARYFIDDVVAPDGDVPRRGPWEYEGGNVPMHGWALGELLADSKLCGTCHDVTTGRDRVDAEGDPLGMKFGEQRTYSEWKNSVYALAGAEFKSCQDCHMPAVEEVAGCAEFKAQEFFHATGGRRHDLAGANRTMVELLQKEYGRAGTDEIDDVFFEIALENIDATLKTAATLEVTPPAMVDLQQGLQGLTVRVTNNTGHKLPSGYSEGRVMWLEVRALHAGTVVYSSGRWDAATGTFEGDAQLRTYEARAVERASGEKFHLLRNDFWEVDSRLPPKGLKQDVETDPVGDRYLLQADETWPHWDETSYAFPAAAVIDTTPGEPDALELEVRLLYLINTPEYLEFLADANVTNMAGQHALDLFARGGERQPTVVATWSGSVPAVGLVEGAGESTGAGSESGAPPTTGSATTETPTTGSPETTGAAGTSSGTGSTSAGATGGGDEPAGCSCDARGVAGGWLLLPLLGLLRRRRR